MNNVKESIDYVNRPQHYADRKFEVIDVMKDTQDFARYVGYLEGCVIKYIMRWDKKDNPVQDLRKAQWYLERLIGEVEEYHAMAR